MKKLLQKMRKFLLSPSGASMMVLALVLTMGFPHMAQAVDVGTPVKDTTAQAIATMLALGIDFLNTLLWPFLLIIGDLMDPQLILGPGMGDRLLAIWVQMRNLVNIIFVLVLLAVAFYNVLGFGGGEGELAIKTVLPKIVLGLILVNFTFVGGRIAIDLTNVATTTIFAIPEVIDESTGGTDFDFEKVEKEFTRNVCVKDYIEEDPTDERWWVYWNETTDGDDIPFHTKLLCQPNATDGNYDDLNAVMKDNYFQSLNANNVGLIMAVNMGSLSSLGLLKPEGIEGFSDLTLSMLFSLAMYVVFAISYIVLGIVLITRLVVLWLALALSPLAVLVYVVPQIKEWAGGGGDVSQKVIKQLISPIIIAATMTMGYLMMSAWNETANAGLSFSGVSVDTALSSEFLLRGTDDLPQFIIAIASIVIVWVGVFAAASGTYAEFATNTIKDFGETVGGALAKAPLLIPTVPVLSEEGDKPARLSPLALFQGAENAAQFFGSGASAQKQWDDFLENKPAWQEMLGQAPRNVAPETGASDIQNILGGRSEINRTEVQRIAKIMSDVVNSHSKSEDKKVILDQLNAIAAGRGTLRDLQTLVDKHPDAESFGFNSSGWAPIKEALSTSKGLKEVTSNTETKTTETKAKETKKTSTENTATDEAAKTSPENKPTEPTKPAAEPTAPAPTEPSATPPVTPPPANP